MTLAIDPERTHVVIETTARGLLARLAHDLRIEAGGARGEALSDAEVRAVFPVERMRVVDSRRHGTRSWSGPPDGDRATIEQKIRDEVFAGVREVNVAATLVDEKARIEVSTSRGRDTVVVPVALERTETAVRARGEARLSLAALHTGEPSVPFGAIKLESEVIVRFDVVLARRA